MAMGEAFMEMESEVLQEKFVSKKLFQFLSATAAATGTFTLGILFAWSSPCLGKIKTDENFEGVTAEELSWIASLFPVGAIFSGSLAGFLLKQFGGQRSMLSLCLPTIIGWLLIAFASNIQMIYAGRFILGLCNGAQLILVPIYVSEIAEESIRGIATAPFAILCSLGILFVYATGSIVSWTTLTLISAAFPAIFMVLLFFIPESPAYLISKGNKVKAREALMWLRGTNNPLHVQDELLNIQANQEDMASERVKLRDFFRAEVLKPVLMILTIMAIQQFSGITCVLFFASRILEAAKTGLDADLCTVIIGVVNLACAFIFMFLVEKAGRKCLLIASCVVCSISLMALGAFFYMDHLELDTSHLSALPISALVVFNIAFAIGLGPVPWILMAELLPRKVVGSASGLSLTFNWTLAFLMAKTFDTFVELLGEFGCFWMFSGFCLIGVIFAVVFVPETKGKTFEEIQNQFRSKSKTYFVTRN